MFLVGYCPHDLFQHTKLNKSPVETNLANDYDRITLKVPIVRNMDMNMSMYRNVINGLNQASEDWERCMKKCFGKELPPLLLS